MKFDLSLQNFKKPLVDISHRKQKGKNVAYYFGCRKKTLSNFLASSSSLKTSWMKIVVSVNTSPNYISFLIALPLMFSVVHEHRLQEYSKCRAYQTLFKFTHRYKFIKQKNKYNKFLIMLKFNFINAHSNNPQLVTGWPLYRWFWKYF